MNMYSQRKPRTINKRKWTLARRKTPRKSLSIRGPVYDELRAYADAQGKSVASVVEGLIAQLRSDKPEA